VLQYLLDAIKKYNTNILALQEIRWPNDGNMKNDDKTIFYSGRKDGRHENGVGFVVSDDTLPQVK
jgi:exonuclease III